MMDDLVTVSPPSTPSLVAAHLAAVDYVMLAVMLAIALGIGIYQGLRSRNGTVSDYYFGSGTLSPVALGLSIALTSASAYTVLGISAQTYYMGMVIGWFVVAGVVAQVVAHVYYIPLLRRLNLISIYEYLGRRFHPWVRSIASILAILNMIIYQGINVYVPAMALNAVTTLDLNVALMITAFICTVYTTVGGIKAVVWTDCLQGVIMILGQIVICWAGVYKVGGFQKIFDNFEAGYRLNMFNFDIDPTQNGTFWSCCIGFAIALSGATCADQAVLTRYLSCKSTRDARKANIVAMIPSVFIQLSALLVGAIMYSYYIDCFPLFSGVIQKPDQLLPYMALKLLEDYQGLTGLFISGLFSGALSTVSSGLNALSIVAMEDFVLKLRPNLTEKTRLFFSKLLVMVFGCVILAVAFCLSKTEATFIDTFITISGTVAGPILGLFTLGVFVPWANTKGAIVGQMLATTIGLWTSIGSYFYPKSPEKTGVMPLPYEGCPANTTFPPPSPIVIDDLGLKDTLYAISPYDYVVFSVLIVIIVGTIVSFLTTPNRPADMDPAMFVPIVDISWLPAPINSFFRFGVPPLPDDDHYKEAPLESTEKSSEYTMTPISNRGSSIIAGSNRTGSSSGNSRSSCEVEEKYQPSVC